MWSLCVGGWGRDVRSCLYTGVFACSQQAASVLCNSPQRCCNYTVPFGTPPLVCGLLLSMRTFVQKASGQGGRRRQKRCAVLQRRSMIRKTPCVITYQTGLGCDGACHGGSLRLIAAMRACWPKATWTKILRQSWPKLMGRSCLNDSGPNRSGGLC